MEKVEIDGWQEFVPYKQRVAHYFRGDTLATSLCGRVSWFRGSVVLGGVNAPAGTKDCAACTRKVTKIRDWENA